LVGHVKKHRPGSGDRRYGQLHGLAPAPYTAVPVVACSRAEKEDLRSQSHPPLFRLVPRARNARIPAALTGACWPLGGAGVWRAMPVFPRAVARRQTALQPLSTSSAGASVPAAAGTRGGFWRIRRPGRVRAQHPHASCDVLVRACRRTRPWSGQACQLEVNAVPGLA
jgi:hypothetical protein